jgi:RND superfamily putative drug exporter
VAVFLHRLGRWAFHRRKTVLVAWVLALVALGGLAGAFSRSADAQLTIPGVESVTALETLQQRFPDGGPAGPPPAWSSPLPTALR